jgi:hypothetical protein
MNDPHQSAHPSKHPARARRNTPRSRQARALRKLVLVFAGLSVLVLGATAYAYIMHRQELSADHIRQITEAAGIKCNDFFLPIWSTASVIRQWGESGILRENKIATLNAKLLPLLEQVPHIQAMRIVSPEGRLIYGLMRHDGQWAACLVPETDAKSPNVTWQFYERNGAEMKGQFESGPPDPLTRQRWAEARDQSATNLLGWTPPYPLFPTGDVGMSAISGWGNDGQSLTFGMDFRMADITQLLNEIKVTESTIFFLFAQGRLLVDFQETADDPTTAMIIGALDDWTQRPRPMVLSASNTMAFPGGASWWMPMKVPAGSVASASLPRKRN